MIPVLSQHLGWAPVWFWTETMSPICKGANGPVALLAVYASIFLTFHLARATSLSWATESPILVGSDRLPSLMGDGREGPYRTTVRLVSDPLPVRGYSCTVIMLR